MSTVGGSNLDVYDTTIGGTPLIRQSGGGGDGVDDKYLEFNQSTPSSRWVISHPAFGKIPAIQAKNLAGNEIIPEVESSTYIQTVLVFNPAVAGKATLY